MLFRSTTRRGTKVALGRVVVFVHRSGSERPARGGVVTSKAVGNSVVRHRTARRIRAALSAALEELPAGTDVVVKALPGASTDGDLQADVREAVARASRGGR